MTQTYSPELAKQGNPKAIAALINESLQVKGVIVEASLASGCLTLVAKSREAPNQASLVDFIRKGMASLNPALVEKVVIQGQVTGQSVPLWHEEFNLKPSSNKVSAETHPREGTLRELFTRYLGEIIGINYKSPTKYEEAKLIEAEDEYLFVIGKETQARQEHTKWIRDKRVESYSNTIRYLIRALNKRSGLSLEGGTVTSVMGKDVIKEWFDDLSEILVWLSAVSIYCSKNQQSKIAHATKIVNKAMCDFVNNDSVISDL